MSGADYAHCGYCNRKAFYDADTDTRDTVAFHPDCLAEHDRAVAAKTLREAAGEWRTEEPQRSTYAHAQFFARELDLRADRIEAGETDA